MDVDSLPKEILKYLPNGYEHNQGVWLVRPRENGSQQSIVAVNQWLRAEDWYPIELQSIIWFGDDGVGNFLGWNQESNEAILWNPEDGAEPSYKGSVSMLWSYIRNAYTEIA